MPNHIASGETILTVEASLHHVQQRLEQFAKLTETTQPTAILDNTGAPTDELLKYCAGEGVNLDWLFCNDIRALLRSYREANRKFAH